MNRDQYAQKQIWLQGESSGVGALNTPGKQAGSIGGEVAPSGQPLSGASADKDIAYVLRRHGRGASAAPRWLAAADNGLGIPRPQVTKR